VTPEKNPERPDDFAPETVNDEQDDENSQAHVVADDALDEDDDSPTESTKPKSGAYDDEDSTQDLVDHMRDMESSGRIDMGAFEGEPDMDDNEGQIGEGLTKDAEQTAHKRPLLDS
jgi:hypothetical protein